MLLDEVAVKPEAKWVLAEGADAAAMTRSVPMAKALDDAIVVYAQNGERLRREQGYPLRLLLPGFEGNMNIKWLRRLKLGDKPWQSREETSKYTDLMPDGKARQFTFIMEAKSVITRPSGGQKLTGGPGFYEITGLAWTGRGRITKVEVSTNGGQTWQQTWLQEASAAGSVDAVPRPMAMGWRSGHTAEPRHRRDRIPAASSCRARRRARGKFSLSLQRHPDLADCPERSSDC